MGSVSQSSLGSKLLERTHILKEILNHVDEYASEFDKIDYPALKEDVLKPVLAEAFDPETQIRGFLKTFRHTLIYKAAFASIESQQLRNQIDDFIDGKSVDDVVDGKEFHLASHKSPGVHHHFSLLAELKKLVLGAIELKEAVEDVFHPKHKHVKDLPVVFEDASATKVVEVTIFPIFLQLITDKIRSATARYRSKTGVKP
jgi:hypothetical protein